MNQLIWTKQNALTEEFCSHVIHKFEHDERKSKGLVGAGLKLDTKRSTDLSISILSDWKEEDNVFYNSLQEGLEQYNDYCLGINLALNFRCQSTSCSDSGYQIQRTQPEEFYEWHNDWDITSTKSRVVTFIWYLNDIQDGGYTEFADGTHIQPETGKLLFFPATWTYAHRGVSPKSETKYICTGWIYSDIE